MNRFKDYIAHQLQAKSKKGFGIHSPYLFYLVSEIINDFTPFYSYSDIEKQRSQLLKDTTKIEVSDLGTGALKSQNKRSVAAIAKKSLKPARQAQLLFRLVNYFKSQTILELGTSLGITTSYLAKVSGKNQIVSIEGCPNISAYARQSLQNLHIENVCLKTGDINNVLLTALHELKTVDFVFFDANHAKDATLNYFRQCLAFKNNNTVFVFDDIYHSSEMKEAWQEIIAHDTVSASLDLFHFGLVFFRSGMTKEHIKIRF